MQILRYILYTCFHYVNNLIMVLPIHIICIAMGQVVTVTTYPKGNFTNKIYCSSTLKQNYRSWLGAILVTNIYNIYNNKLSLCTSSCQSYYKITFFLKSYSERSKIVFWTNFFSGTLEKLPDWQCAPARCRLHTNVSQPALSCTSLAH